jgi:hypothetical protein
MSAHPLHVAGPRGTLNGNLYTVDLRALGVLPAQAP